MRIFHGNKRIVIVLDKIVIKIAKISFMRAIKIAIFEIKHRVFLKNLLRYNYRMYGTIHMALLSGIMENWNEYRFYYKTQSLFLVPTYFTFFLFNIQKRGEMLELKEKVMWNKIVDIIGRRIMDDPHHFENPNNFCKTNNRLQMLDYGSLKCHNIVLEFGDKIQQDFKFDD